MNHSFVSASWNKLVCAGYRIERDGKVVSIVCLRKEHEHADDAQCESCANKGPCEVIDKMLMCAECQIRQQSTKPEIIAKEEKLSLEQVMNQVNRIVDTNAIETKDGDSVKTIIDEAIAGNIKEYKDFFNAKIPSITSLKEMIDNDETIESDKKHYALMHVLYRRVQYLSRVLFMTSIGQREIGAEVKSIQQYMSETIPQLRMKLRAEFAAITPNYTPQVVQKTPKIRKSGNPADKLAESYAKMMKITIEEAKIFMERKLRNECTCKETPGMCKVHNK